MNKPTARKNDIVVQQLENETLVYDLKINKAFCLNETSALVWSLCDGNRTASEISDEMSKRLKTLISEEFVWIALGQFHRDGLLEGEIEDRFAGLSRREVIRKVGFASVIALPMVSSLIAPTAGMAQSTCLATNDICTTSSQCCTNNCVSALPRPAACCEPGVTQNFIPGALPPPCVTTASECGPVGATMCCSGSASIDPFQGSCPSGQTRCRCN